MNIILRNAIAVYSVLLLGIPNAAAQDRKVRLAACIDSGFADLISEKGKEFLSPRFQLICQKESRDRKFEYRVPEGFRIGNARFEVDTKTNWSRVGKLTTEPSKAVIELQCDVSKSDGVRHLWIAGNIVGSLIYQPTVDDSKGIAANCLDQVLQ